MAVTEAVQVAKTSLLGILHRFNIRLTFYDVPLAS